MPVFHSRAFRSTDMDEEFYGPWDGILPEQYPTIYLKLMRLVCLQGPGIIHEDHYDIYKRKICQKCYEWLPESRRFFYPQAFNHLLTLRSSALAFRDCKLCGSELYTVYHARRCAECIEMHFNFDDEGVDEGFLRQGNAINVITQW